MISIPPRVNNSNEKLSLSTETYVVKDDDVANVDDLQKSISLNDGTVSENLKKSKILEMKHALFASLQRIKSTFLDIFSISKGSANREN